MQFKILARKIFLFVARAVTARNVQKMEILSPQTTCGKFGCKKFEISLFKESGWWWGGGGFMGTPGPPLATSLQLSEKMNTFFTLLMNKGCFQWVSLEKH